MEYVLQEAESDFFAYTSTSDEHQSSKHWTWLSKDVSSILIPTKEHNFLLQASMFSRTTIRIQSIFTLYSVKQMGDRSLENPLLYHWSLNQIKYGKLACVYFGLTHFKWHCYQLEANADPYNIRHVHHFYFQYYWHNSGTNDKVSLANVRWANAPHIT
jgi:hypothetical protein